MINTVCNMDCVEGMRTLDDNSVDLTVTSPEYCDIAMKRLDNI